jgi:hypothetical protein
MPAPFGIPMCSYELDERLIIRALGPGWNESALDNNAADLLSPAPIGRPLLMFLTDATTVMLHEALFQRVSASRRTMTFPIRCDAPHLRRYLNVSVAPRPAGGFIVSTLLVRSESRPAIALFANGTPRRDDLLDVCSWCKRVKAHGRWVEVEEAIALLHLFERREQPLLTHGICESCHHFMQTMLADDSKLPPR